MSIASLPARRFSSRSRLAVGALTISRAPSERTLGQAATYVAATVSCEARTKHASRLSGSIQ